MKFSVKMLREKIKQGWTTEQFAENLDMSIDEFYVILKRNYIGEADLRKIFWQLKENERLKRINSRSRLVKDNKPKEPATKTKDNTSDIELLKKKQESLITSSAILEGEYEQLSKDKELCISKLNTKKIALEKLKFELQQEKKECQTLVEKLNELEEKMALAATNFQKIQDEISTISNKITKLISVEILVYSNGDIEVSDELIKVGEGDDEIYRRLVSEPSPIFESLTLKQIKQLSKLVPLVKNIEKQDRKYDICFESDEIEEAFMQMFLN